MTTSPNKGLNKMLLQRGWGKTTPSLLVLVILILYPLLALFGQIVFPHLYDVKMSFAVTLKPFLSIFQDANNLKAVSNSFVIGAAAAVLSMILGTVTAFAGAQLSKTGRRTLSALIWVVFFTPSYVIAEGWMMLMQDGGILTHLIHMPNGATAWFFTKYGLMGVMAFRYFPFVHLAMEQAIVNLGDDFSFAGRLAGGSRTIVFRKIILPLLTPALLAGGTIAFAEGFSDFGFAAAITPQIHIPLMAYQIYTALYQAPIDYSAAAGLSLLMIAVTATTLLLQMWWMNRRSYVTISSGNRPARHQGTPWAAVASFAILFIALVLPLGSTFIQSLWKSDMVTLSVSSWTLANYTHLFTSVSGTTVGTSAGAMSRSLIYATVAATLTMGIGLFVSYQMIFKKSPVTKLLNVFLMGTIAIPGIVLGASYIFAWNARWLIPLHLVLYGSSTCLAMAYVAGHLPYTIRLQMGSLTQVSGSLVTAAKLLGASEWRVVRRIIFPLVSATTVSTFFLTFTDTVFELPASSLLYPAGAPPFPVVVQQTFMMFAFNKGAALAIIGMAFLFAFYLIGQSIAWRLEPKDPLLAPAAAKETEPQILERPAPVGFHSAG